MALFIGNCTVSEAISTRYEFILEVRRDLNFKHSFITPSYDAEL